MKELERLQKEIGEAYSIMPVEQLYKMNKENDELRRQLAIRDELSCGTCEGFGNVLIAPDDGIDCPECVKLDNKIKAEGIMELVTDKAYSTQVNGIATSIICADSAINYANQLKEGGV